MSDRQVKHMVQINTSNLALPRKEKLLNALSKVYPVGEG